VGRGQEDAGHGANIGDSPAGAVSLAAVNGTAAARRAADLLAAGAVAAAGILVETARGLARSRRPAGGAGVPKLLTLEADYSLATIRDLRLEHIVTSRDLDGFFDHVWTVNPLVGAAPDDRPRTVPGPPSITEVAPRHTMIEGKVGWSPALAAWPTLNFVLAQWQLLAGVGRLIRRERIPVVRASDPLYLGLVGFLLARANRRPLVLHIIANYDGTAFVDTAAYPRLFGRRSVEKRIERFLLPRADLVAAGNRDLLDYSVNNGADPERCTVFLVGNLIDAAHFDWEPADRPSVRDEMGVSAHPFVITVGRLEPLKHPDDVVRVIADPRLVELGLRAVLVGDGGMRAELESLAAGLGVEDRLVFAGKRDQEWLARAYASADVILSPLTGRALIEGTLSATPAVAYDIDWQAELVSHGETGLLVPYRDTAAMAGAVFELLSQPDYAAALGAAGRERTRKVMDPQALLDHERAAYLGLLPETAPEGAQPNP
jgi:glycosyltransferase involved in cell wall biosynthesis